MTSSVAKNLYNSLRSLVDRNDSFNLIGQSLDGDTYHIFSYRLASYTDFCEENAMEARGIMFELTRDGDVRIASRTPLKFFNYRENPFTMDIDFDKDVLTSATLKEDGSLISTFTHSDGSLRLKTKQSVGSQQAQDATEWLRSSEKGKDLKKALEYAEAQGYTVSLEWCSPSNRIVVAYPDSKLVVLMARHRETGETLPRETLEKWFGSESTISHHNHLVELYKFDDPISLVEGMKDVKDNIEGIVCTCASGLMFKIKTDWYASLHHLKDSISSPRRLFNAVIDEAVDDVKAFFSHDELLMAEIEEMERFAAKIYHENVNVSTAFFNENKNLERKDYAIKGQRALTKLQFTFAMLLYVGKTPNFKEHIKKNWSEFYLQDIEESL